MFPLINFLYHHLQNQSFSFSFTSSPHFTNPVSQDPSSTMILKLPHTLIPCSLELGFMIEANSGTQLNYVKHHLPTFNIMLQNWTL